MTSTYPRISDISDVTWHQLPSDGGQIVDVTYAVDGEYLYRRSYDRSDGELTITRRHIAEDGEIGFEPQNCRLPDTDGDEETVYDSLWNKQVRWTEEGQFVIRCIDASK